MLSVKARASMSWNFMFIQKRDNIRLTSVRFHYKPADGRCVAAEARKINRGLVNCRAAARAQRILARLTRIIRELLLKLSHGKFVNYSG
jgi:hypothetical protein